MRFADEDVGSSLVIFDCDGVLVDSEVIACRVDAECLTEAGFPVTTEEMATRFVGTSAKSMLEVLAAQYQRQPSAGLNELRQERIMAAFAAELRPIPGASDALARLRAARCVASSSHLQRIVYSLELTGLRSFFADHLFSSTMVSHGKPAPDLFLYAADRMKVEPAQCVVIEDSPSGVKGAKAAGMRVLGFVGGSHCRAGQAERLRAAGAEVVMRSMAELPDILPQCYTSL
ncbi:MAG TPA: HAD family hydrolase [Tepidisphaeraceae bacterium]|jgi:HAD superfamily hydrolase (TIGR01509 family)|nr:HAD family hydrolase [Tepidisphaeraceae bacterium]